MGAFEDNWYVAAALVLTVGFGLLMTKPEGQHPGSAGDEIAEYAYLSLTLLGTINSILGVWWAGHMVPQVAWHPAGEFSKFWFASLNTSMGHGQQFAKIALEQLMLALIPLCYLQYDLKGLVLASAAVGYFILQLQTQKFLMGRMRAAYDEGVARGVPVMDDVSTLPCHCCSKAHTEGIVGLLTCQLIGTTGFMFRWLTSPSPWPLRGAKSDTSEDQNSKVESVFDLSV